MGGYMMTIGGCTYFDGWVGMRGGQLGCISKYFIRTVATWPSTSVISSLRRRPGSSSRLVVISFLWNKAMSWLR